MNFLFSNDNYIQISLQSCTDNAFILTELILRSAVSVTVTIKLAFRGYL